MQHKQPVHIIKKNMLVLSEKFLHSQRPLKNLNALGDGGFVITNEKDYMTKLNFFEVMALKEEMMQKL